MQFAPIGGKGCLVWVQRDPPGRHIENSLIISILFTNYTTITAVRWNVEVRTSGWENQSENDFCFNWSKCWVFSFIKQTWESSAHHASSHEIKCTATTSEHSVTAFYTLHIDSWNECTKSRSCQMLWIIKIMDPKAYISLFFFLFVKFTPFWEFRISAYKMMILFFPKNTMVALLVNWLLFLTSHLDVVP